MLTHLLVPTLKGLVHTHDAYVSVVHTCAGDEAHLVTIGPSCVPEGEGGAAGQEESEAHQGGEGGPVTSLAISECCKLLTSYLLTPSSASNCVHECVSQLLVACMHGMCPLPTFGGLHAWYVPPANFWWLACIWVCAPLSRTHYVLLDLQALRARTTCSWTCKQ